MAVKVFNHTDDQYIEGDDTRQQNKALLGSLNDGYGFWGVVVAGSPAGTYTVKAGSVLFIGGLCVRVMTDETHAVGSSSGYIGVVTEYESPTDKYFCTIRAITSVEITDERAGDVKKVYPFLTHDGVIVDNLKNRNIIVSSEPPPVQEGVFWAKV